MAHKHQIIARRAKTRTGQHQKERRQKRQVLNAITSKTKKGKTTRRGKPKALPHKRVPPDIREHLATGNEIIGDRLGDLLNKKTQDIP